ncbi:HNH endonuclease [Streptomyces sp. NBC_01591]|uniref:HNH endonuclease n=1 Tax=Streptomyces sp. NBC_01591 TaxID=2975888 RepID=UPI002DD9969B|nr:HNH endonuclease [Streptomyces sp. NBC_01591]WSD71682.1 HNH endonuclease [Streptomyces sp. NBC_01591]
MAVSKRLRYEILRRDNHTCRYCGATAPDAPLCVDHVTPVALGGTDTPNNLVTSCEPCNSGKSSATVDAAVVAGVSDDALRWADAMKQAAANMLEQEKPKLEYRAAFRAEWDRWEASEGKPIELPSDWKPSVERFRVAGLPSWVWGDIVDTAMGYDKVLNSNKFKYCCGIAWNKVTAMQEEARRIVGASPMPVPLDSRKSVIEAALTVWRCGLVENEKPPTTEQEDEFRRSLGELSDLDPERIIQAAQYATYFGTSNIAVALRDMDHDAASRAWRSAWPTTWVPGNEPWGGKFVGGPTDEQQEWVKEQIEKLLDADVYVTRIVQAASYAGSHKSARIYHGLSDEELELTGISGWHSRASELWRVAYTASGMAEPTEGEASRFFASLKRIGMDGEFYLADVYEAASAAGSYQDPDVTTCLTRHLSVFEAAALPVGGKN